MLNRKQLVVIVSTILLSTSNFNLFCAATTDIQATTSTPQDALSQNRQRIMEIIQELAPELHAKITKLDPDFSDHVIAGRGLAVKPINYDGLPIIIVNNEFRYESKESQKAGIAHELGHYVLQHVLFEKSTYNERGNDIFKNEQSSAKNTTSTQLKTPKKTLNPNKAMTDAYVRTYEYEADAAIMKLFGLPLTDGQAMIKEMNDSTAGCTTFSINHPKDENRAKQLESIDDELKRLGKKNADGTYKTEPIDWDQTQYDVLKFTCLSSSRSFESFENAVKEYLPNRQDLIKKATTETYENNLGAGVNIFGAGVKIEYSADGKRIKSTTKYKADGGKIVNQYHTDGKTIISKTEYNADGTTNKYDIYGDKIVTQYADGKPIISKTEYNTDGLYDKTVTQYYADGKTIMSTSEYSSMLRCKIVTQYNTDGKTIISKTQYNTDGTTIPLITIKHNINGTKEEIEYYYGNTKKLETYYYVRGAKDVIEYKTNGEKTVTEYYRDGKTKKLKTFYNTDGKTITVKIEYHINGQKTVTQYNPNGMTIKLETFYQTDGAKTVIEYNPDGMTRKLKTLYETDGKTRKSETEYYSDGYTIKLETLYETNGDKTVTEYNLYRKTKKLKTLYQTNGDKIVTEYNYDDNKELSHTKTIQYDANEKEISTVIEDKDGKVISKTPMESTKIDSPSISMGQGIKEVNNENNKHVSNEIASNKIIMGEVAKNNPGSTLPAAEKPIKPTDENHPPVGTELISHHQAAPETPASHAIAAE